MSLAVTQALMPVASLTLSVTVAHERVVAGAAVHRVAAGLDDAVIAATAAAGVGDRWSARGSALASALRQHVGKLPPGGDVELAEGSAQVSLDGLLGHEQRLGDIAVGAARRG